MRRAAVIGALIGLMIPPGFLFASRIDYLAPITFCLWPSSLLLVAASTVDDRTSLIALWIYAWAINTLWYALLGMMTVAVCRGLRLLLAQ